VVTESDNCFIILAPIIAVMGEGLFVQAAEGANPPGNAQAKGPQQRIGSGERHLCVHRWGKSLRFLTEGRRSRHQYFQIISGSLS